MNARSVFAKFFATVALITLSLGIFAEQTSNAKIFMLVSGVSSANGKIACAVFSSEDGFPLDTSEAIVRSQKARQGEAECRFKGLPSRTYARLYSMMKMTMGVST